MRSAIQPDFLAEAGWPCLMSSFLNSQIPVDDGLSDPLGGEGKKELRNG